MTSTALAFAAGLSLPGRPLRRAPLPACCPSPSAQPVLASASPLPSGVTRRSVLAAAAAAAASTLATSPAPPALAEVNFDIDRYGDKELKVSTINSVKQNCRNILTEAPELLPAFFMLCVHDALSYNAETNEGGPNGSLRLELDRPENAYLKDAYDALVRAREESRRDVSFADTFAFAGSVASELANGPKIVLQLGRDDAKVAGPAGGLQFFRPSSSAEELMKCFEIAGLAPAADVVLIHAAEGALADIAKQRVEKLAAAAAVAGGDDEFGDVGDENVDDVTYGRVTAKKRGAVLVSSNVSNLTLGGKKFGNFYLKALLEAKKKGKLDGLSDRDRAIVSSREMLPFVEQYASNNSKFTDDLADLFQRMSLLGSNFESLRLQD